MKGRRTERNAQKDVKNQDAPISRVTELLGFSDFFDFCIKEFNAA